MPMPFTNQNQPVNATCSRVGKPCNWSFSISRVNYLCEPAMHALFAASFLNLALASTREQQEKQHAHTHTHTHTMVHVAAMTTLRLAPIHSNLSFNTNGGLYSNGKAFGLEKKLKIASIFQKHEREALENGRKGPKFCSIASKVSQVTCWCQSHQQTSDAYYLYPW